MKCPCGRLGSFAYLPPGPVAYVLCRACARRLYEAGADRRDFASVLRGRLVTRR